MDMKIKLYQLFSISLLLLFPTFSPLLYAQNQNTIIKIGVRAHSESVPALEEKVAELERMNDLFVGREHRIKELRDKVTKLEGGRDG